MFAITILVYGLFAVLLAGVESKGLGDIQGLLGGSNKGELGQLSKFTNLMQGGKIDCSMLNIGAAKKRRRRIAGFPDLGGGVGGLSNIAGGGSSVGKLSALSKLSGNGGMLKNGNCPSKCAFGDTGEMGELVSGCMISALEKQVKECKQNALLGSKKSKKNGGGLTGILQGLQGGSFNFKNLLKGEDMCKQMVELAKCEELNKKLKKMKRGKGEKNGCLICDTMKLLKSDTEEVGNTICGSFGKNKSFTEDFVKKELKQTVTKAAVSGTIEKTIMCQMGCPN